MSTNSIDLPQIEFSLQNKVKMNHMYVCCSYEDDGFQNRTILVISFLYYLYTVS